MKLKKILSLLLSVAILSGFSVTGYAEEEAEVQTSIIVRPTVMINAGEMDGYSPKFDYSATGAQHALMRTGDYNNPNKSVTAGIFLRWQLPAIPDGYEVKRAYIIAGHKHTNQFKSDGYQNGSVFIYHLNGDIEEDFAYYSDTAAYPDKNLKTLIPTASNSYAATSKFKFKGTTTNYYDKVQDDTQFYSLGISLKNYTKNLCSTGKPVDLSTLMVSNQDLTFNGSKDLDYGPVVWYMEVDKLLDADFIFPETIAAGKSFDTAVDVSMLDERIASVVLNVNGANYTAALSDGKWTASIPGLAEGEYTVKATITDIYENVKTKTQNITVSVVSEPVDIGEFVSKAYAHKGDGFGLAFKANTDDVSEVSFTVEGTEYPASLYNGNWVAYVPGIENTGTYEITASVKDTESRTVNETQTFTVYDKATILGSTDGIKYQSSDGKMWQVKSANNYDLLYNNSTVMDCLYSIIDISSITNPDLIEEAYFVTSIANPTQTTYAKMIVEKCEEFSSDSFTSGKAPEAFPETLETVASGNYSNSIVTSKEADYNILASKVPVKSGTTANYIKLDATNYIKNLDSDTTMLHLRTSVSHKSGGTYARVTHNTDLKLYIKYKDSETIDNYDGTTSYVVDARDYGRDTVWSTAVKYGENIVESIDSCNTAGRILYRYKNGEENKIIYVWDDYNNIFPMRDPINVK